MTETPEPFLIRDGEAYIPTLKANGWWREGGNLHARVMIGLFAHVIEQQYGEPDFQPTRLTADLYRLPDLSPLTVATRLIRQGGRIKMIEAELFSGGVSSARASCQLLRRGQQPVAPLWSQAPWDAPPPDKVPPPAKPFTDRWEMRPILPPGLGKFFGNDQLRRVTTEDGVATMIHAHHRQPAAADLLVQAAHRVARFRTLRLDKGVDRLLQHGGIIPARWRFEQLTDDA